jgi:hypothetical protein
LQVGEANGEVLGTWHFNQEAFSAETIAAMSFSYESALASLVQNPASPLSCLFSAARAQGYADGNVAPVENIPLRMRRLRKQADVSGIDFAAESQLDPDISPKGKLPDTQRAARHLFLTGATGFVGAFLLDELLKRTTADIWRVPKARPTACAACART